jgi:hypothetical protein
MKSKLVVLDFINQITYVFDYDRAVFDDGIECIMAANDEFGLDISIDNCNFMEVDEFNLKIL